MHEIALNICLGVVTGIVSGCLVTVYYRKKDSEREFVLYSEQLLNYAIRLFNAYMPFKLIYMDSKEIITILAEMEQPHRYSWIKAPKEIRENNNIITAVEDDCSSFISNLLAYSDALLMQNSHNMSEDSRAKYKEICEEKHNEIREIWLKYSKDWTKLLEFLRKYRSEVEKSKVTRYNMKNNISGYKRIFRYFTSCRWVSAVVSTVLATMLSTLFLSMISKAYTDYINQRELEKSIGSIYLGCNREWIDEKLGEATFTINHSDYIECVYISEIAAVRAFYGTETESCEAFFVTALSNRKIETLKLPGIYSHVTNGKSLGEYSYYDIQDKPLGIDGYVTNGDARIFYMEQYYYGAGNYYEYYFCSMDYGAELSGSSFESNMVPADDVSYVDDEVQGDFSTPLVLVNRKQVKPNTYGMSYSEVSTRIKELISDYRNFDSRQIVHN